MGITNNEILFNKYRIKIFDMLKYCQERVPFYKQAWNKSFMDNENFNYSSFSRNIPVLEKDDVRKNSDLLISDDYNKNNLLFETTSGTTGEPTFCYKSPEEKMRCGIRLWKSRKKFSSALKPSDKHAHFYSFRETSSSIVASQTYKNQNNLYLSLFNLSDAILIEYWEEIIAFGTKWIMGPPSAIYMLAIVCEKYALQKYSFDLVEITGEFVSEHQLHKIKEAFQCPVGIHYGCREFWGVAYGASNDKLELLDDLFIETLYNPTLDKCELVATSLTNDSWPLIRYKIGDVADLYTNGDEKYKISLHSGRITTYCNLINGQKISPILITSIARIINTEIKCNIIYQCQLIKISLTKIQINICVSSKSNYQMVIKKFLNHLNNYLDDQVEVTIDVLEYLKPDVKTGKVKDYIDFSPN